MKTHPIFVLDGPDGVGKTTLAKAMCEKYSAKYLHLTYRFNNKMFTYHHAALEYILTEAQKQPMVLDRWWLSEIAYANVYRSGTKWPMAKYLFESVALKHCFTYVICLPFNKQEYHDDYNVLKGKREEMYNSSMDKVYDEFHTMWREYFYARPLAIRYDWKKFPGDSISQFIQMVWEQSEDHRILHNDEQLDRHFLNVTGDQQQALYMFVGDRSNAKSRRQTWPFFEYGNSSLWLAETLDYLGIPPDRLMLANANYENMEITTKLIKRAWNDDVKIIAMGTQADTYLSLERIPHSRIQHPQYYRRFASSKGIDDLRSVLK